MFNWSLLKLTWKQNYLLLIIFTLVGLMYVSVMITMFNPEDVSALSDMMALLPTELVSAMGFADVPTNLTGFLANFLYGFILLAFPMVYSVIVGNKLIAKTVDDGSIEYLLTTGTSRTAFMFMRMDYLVTSIIIMFLVIFGSGWLISELMFPGHLDVWMFFNLNLTTMLIILIVAMISFTSSAIFNDSKRSLAFGAGIPIGFFLLFMLGGVSEQGAFLKEISFFNLLDTTAILNGEFLWVANGIALAIIIALGIASTIVFNKKSI